VSIILFYCIWVAQKMKGLQGVKLRGAKIMRKGCKE